MKRTGVIKPYRVHVVVDPHYGERIRDLPVGEPAWVVDSIDNKPIIRTIWQQRKTTEKIEGITSFVVDGNATPEDWLISELYTIDLHHGELSHNPAYSVLNVVGIGQSDRLRKALAEIGLTEIKNTADGFEARRK